MKYFKKTQLYITAFLLLLFTSCSKEGSYNLEDTPPLDLCAIRCWAWPCCTRGSFPIQ